jgi:6,7-dimethyl-8-ribityllumazine synthase
MKKSARRAAAARAPRYAILISRYHREVTEGMLEGAQAYLAEQGARVRDEDVFDAPGAFEMPLLAQELARTGRYAGVICLGCVIKGDTAHFEFISLGAATGIMQGMLATRTPIAFGILTTYTDEQALTRARPGPENKGREAASACHEAARALVVIRRSRARR